MFLFSSPSSTILGLPNLMVTGYSPSFQSALDKALDDLMPYLKRYDSTVFWSQLMLLELEMLMPHLARCELKEQQRFKNQWHDYAELFTPLMYAYFDRRLKEKAVPIPDSVKDEDQFYQWVQEQPGESEVKHGIH